MERWIIPPGWKEKWSGKWIRYKTEWKGCNLGKIKILLEWKEKSTHFKKQEKKIKLINLLLMNYQKAKQKQN